MPFTTAAAQNAQPGIAVVVVSGEGAIDRLRERVSQDPEVRIEDQNHQPVAGAVVTFNLPISGTSGEFANGARNLTVTTGADGLAAARDLRTNDVPGRLQILITASYRGLTARGLINQATEGTPLAKGHGAGRGGHGKLVVILAAVGAAAAGGAYAATRSKGGTSASVPAGAAIGITPGTGTITHP